MKIKSNVHMYNMSFLGRRSASCGVCVFISVAIILTAGCMFGKIWIHLIDVSKFEDVNVYEDVTVILGEVDRFYHWQLKITSVHVPLGQHHVDVYAHNSECSQLPTVSNNLYVKHISNSTEDYAHLYLPPESIIQYKISPVSSLNNVSTDIKGRAFITYGPEINLFTPRTCHGPLRSPDCKIFDQQSYNGTELFHTFKSHQRGYYNVHIRVNSEYMFHLNITSLAIDRNQTEHKCRIDQGNSSCYIDLSFDVSWRKVCLVAYTEHPSETDHQDFPLYTTLAMKVSGLWIQWVLLITLTPFVTFYVIILTVIAFWYCFHTMRSSHNPAFSKPVPLKLDI